MLVGGRERYQFTNATIVAGDRIIEGGTVAIEHGAIAEVAPRSYAPSAVVHDLGRRLLIPGLVDLHNDALEKEITPRPGAEFDPAFALLHLDRKLAAAGVTTEFHAVYFGERESGRSVTFANALTGAIASLAASDHATIDHRVLYRLDLRSPSAFDPLLAALADAPGPYASFNDHVPGQGQFNNLDAYRHFLRSKLPPGATETDIEESIAAQMRDAAATEAAALAQAERLSAAIRERRGILASHDDDTPERVDLMRDLGCTIAEFPITLAAARRAAERGMLIAMGAPNALRGGSLTGNASALDLLSHGLVDLLIADYHASSLLAAAFRIVALGLRDLPGALRLVTEAPARAVGLDDRGAIAPGQRADLLVVEEHAGQPVVAATLVRGVLSYAGGPFASGLAVAPTPRPVAAG